jgi:hypothetical protein
VSVNRRSFIGSIVAFVLAPFAPKLAPKPQGLMLHPDAFVLTMMPLDHMSVISIDQLYGVEFEWIEAGL